MRTEIEGVRGKSFKEETELKCFEKYCPIGMAVIAIIVALLFKLNELTIGHFDSLISALLTISITIIGFIITVLAVLIGLMNEKVMRVLKGTNKISDFKIYLIMPMLYGLILIVISTTLLCIVDSTGLIDKPWVYRLLAVLVAFIVSTIRLVVVLYLFFKTIIDHHFENTDLEVFTDTEEDIVAKMKSKDE